MPYTFTQTERTFLEDKLGGGQYYEAYQFIANRLITDDEFVTGEGFVVGTSPADRDPAVMQAALWFAGAAQVNAGQGIFSEFIRTFTNRQGELRYGEAFSDDEMQLASNQVAINAINNMRVDGWELPNLQTIAEADAAGVGETLFYSDPNDSASTQNSAWSGTILFSMLGSDQTGKLLGGDNQFNTLNDLRDVLFAYDAFLTAYDAVSLWDGLSNNTDDVSVLINTWFNNMFFPDGFTGKDVLESVTSGQAAESAFKFVCNLGAYKLLDELSKVILGQDNASDLTTENNFQARAYALFATAEAEGILDSLNISLEGVSVNQTRTDFSTFLSIFHLSPFALSTSDANVEANLAQKHSEIYDDWIEDKPLTTEQLANGAANFSEGWLKDRAEMFSWKLKYDASGKAYTEEFNTTEKDGNWDYVDLSTGNGSSLTLAIDGNGLSLYDHQIIFGTKLDEQITGSGDTDRLYGMSGNDTLWGGDGNDQLEGASGNDVLYGEAGADKLLGGKNNDILNGGTGTDTMLGGTGNDKYVVDNTGDIVTELANEGTDEVTSSVTYTLGANVENLTLSGTAAINGFGNTLNNTLIGNSANNRLEGGAGNDILIGASGNDTMVGGDGNDIYSVNSTGDVTSETTTGGVDTVYTTASITLQANIENVVVDLTATLVVTGNTLDNIMLGNAAANELRGGKGNDNVTGGDGNDILWGDTSLISGTNATYISGGGDDRLYGGVGADRLIGESGNDKLYGGVGGDTLDGGYGNDELYGEDDADDLNGLYGDDLLYGGNGSDIYRFEKINPLTLKTLGKDTIVDADSSGSVVLYLNTVSNGTTLTSGTAQGNANTWVANTGELMITSGDPNSGRVDLQILGVVIPSTGQRILDVTIKDFVNGDLGITLGGVANHHFKGTDNADVMTGTSGADTLIGKNGNDSYVINHTGDKVVELVDAGTDTVQSMIASYQLSSHLENLELVGNLAVAGYGNSRANIITGNDLNNTLNGDAGNDRIIGGIGADTLTGGLGQDTFIFNSINDFSALNVADLITDFNQSEGDLIDFSVIDANSMTSENDAFTLISADNFSAAGQVRFDSYSNTLYGEINGDLIADFQLVLSGVNFVTQADFIA